MDSEEGQLFVKNLAHFVRTHEKALANALQMRRQRDPRSNSTQGPSNSAGGTSTSNSQTSATPLSASSALAAALSLPYLNFSSHSIKPAKLALTPHHLFYLLSQFEDLGIQIGPTNVRLENLHEVPSNYVSFLSQSRTPRGPASDRDSIHSVSSMRSVMSGMSSLWSNFGLSSASSTAKVERQKNQTQTDLKYLYSAFTKIPCLRLAPDRRARLIKGYEEFPFDTAVPLLAFKNISALEISDIDIRQFFGWDRLAEQLRSLTVKRASIDDPEELLISIVLDDMDKRRRRSSKAQMSPSATWVPSSSPKGSPVLPHAELVKSNSAPGSPQSEVLVDDTHEARYREITRSGSADLSTISKTRQRSISPSRPASSRTGSSHGYLRGSNKVKRSGSTSSHSSNSDIWYHPRGSSSHLLPGILPATKWRFLKNLVLADNSLTSISAASLVPLANTLHSLDLSSNLFVQIPDCLASLTSLRALNLSNCMIDSLHSLTRNPLPAITALNLRSNRLISLAGVERLLPLERLDLRDNKLTDPTELARLTCIPDLREVWVAGNTFARTHSNYRITIFNLFRKTPGYMDDIIIDSSGPGYNERRSLVERVVEKANVSMVKTASQVNALAGPLNKPTVVYDEPANAQAALKKTHLVLDSTTGDIPYTAASRRRRTPKRRIVDLSTTDVSPIKSKAANITVLAESDGSISSSQIDDGTDFDGKLSKVIEPHSIPDHSSGQLDASHLETVIGESPPNSTLNQPSSMELPAVQNQDWSASGELYRKRIENLRSEVGNEWLSVLSEDGWDSHKTSRSGDLNASSTNLGPRPPGQVQSKQALHHGRTLG